MIGRWFALGLSYRALPSVRQAVGVGVETGGSQRRSADLDDQDQIVRMSRSMRQPSRIIRQRAAKLGGTYSDLRQREGRGPMPEVRCGYVRQYDVTLVHGVLSAEDTSLIELIGARRTLVTTTPTVHRLFGDRLADSSPRLASRRPSSSCPRVRAASRSSAVLDVCQAAQHHQLGRRDVVLAFGGGVCSDIAALAASLLRRGTPLIRVPTTLVGQVDAGIGLKSGVNYGGAKNYLGSYLPPKGVLVDPAFLRTLPEREVRCGLSEMLKMALVADASLFELLRLHGPSLIASGFRPRTVSVTPPSFGRST